MLQDTKSVALVKNFAHQWLDLRNVGAIKPDPRMYPDYYRYEIEKWSRRETEAFFGRILRENRSVLEFLDSDWAMLNEPLAKYYGILDVVGDELRPVELEAKAQRGGLVSQASILVMGADGVRTKPVSRAKWLMTTLFNRPPNPPPANAGEVEPNSAGENFTVRQRLDKHRTVATCASCHTKLDPYGLGLENFNAAGQWREFQDGENFRKNQAPPIDAGGRLPSGAEYKDAIDFRQALLSEQTAFVRGLTEKMLSYALGRSLSQNDRPAIAEVESQVAKAGFRFQGLFEAIVQSEAFNSR
jgi:hypothetical protein